MSSQVSPSSQTAAWEGEELPDIFCYKDLIGCWTSKEVLSAGQSFEDFFFFFKHHVHETYGITGCSFVDLLADLQEGSHRFRIKSWSKLPCFVSDVFFIFHIPFPSMNKWAGCNTRFPRKSLQDASLPDFCWKKYFIPRCKLFSPLLRMVCYYKVQAQLACPWFLGAGPFCVQIAVVNFCAHVSLKELFPWDWSSVMPYSRLPSATCEVVIHI